ncbi:unnamed protein product [Amoebophrya sp. A25]|nr:unnamed protein product [Amoebophrya sp. A25]|eukprot:GSA25T00027431001.1
MLISDLFSTVVVRDPHLHQRLLSLVEDPQRNFHSRTHIRKAHITNTNELFGSATDPPEQQDGPW